MRIVIVKRAKCAVDWEWNGNRMCSRMGVQLKYNGIRMSYSRIEVEHAVDSEYAVE